MTSLLERLSDPSPKRILTLDGGGVRGLISLEFLARIESLLQARYGRSDFRLCEYFDLIGGTSTGAVIAAGLAIGYSVDEVRQAYRELASRVFGRRRWSRWLAVYDERPLAEELKRAFGQRPLGDPSLKSGLCLILKRADTNSVWPLINHPQGKFYELNKDIKLWEAVRASTAAPTLFAPQLLNVGNLESAAFIDGAVSMANNPALQTLLVAILKGFPFHWRTGERQLMLTSIGTGRRAWKSNPQQIGRYWLIDWARHVPRMLIDDASIQAQLILQTLSRSPTAIPIDSEIGDLRNDLLTPEPLLHYLRYDVVLEEKELTGMGLVVTPKLCNKLADLAAVETQSLLSQAGRCAADSQVQPEHFPECFDVAATSARPTDSVPA